MKRYRGAQQTVGPNGKVYPSKKQATRATELHLLQKCGAISDLQEEIEFELIPKQDGERRCVYVADFVYMENGELIVEDTKGFKQEVYRIKKKLMLWRRGIRVRET